MEGLPLTPFVYKFPSRLPSIAKSNINSSRNKVNGRTQSLNIPVAFLDLFANPACTFLPRPDSDTQGISGGRGGCHGGEWNSTWRGRRDTMGT